MAQPTAIDQMFAFFAVVHDPRRQHPTTLHTLETILTITILATICGAQNWVEIAHWGQAKAAWLAEFLDLPRGFRPTIRLGVSLPCSPLRASSRPLSPG